MNALVDVPNFASAFLPFQVLLPASEHQTLLADDILDRFSLWPKQKNPRTEMNRPGDFPFLSQNRGTSLFPIRLRSSLRQVF
jgi:hypothetical protein